MRYRKLQKLKNKICFNVEDASEAFGIKPRSAVVLCSRYSRQGLFIRLKKNFYVLAQEWDGFGRREFLRIANILQVPSYISFMTALSYYELTTQVQRNFFESACLKRSAEIGAVDTAFRFYKLKKAYYFDFLKKDGVFIATKEKAFVDTLYLSSLGKYRFDAHSLDFAKLDKKNLRRIIRAYPKKTQILVRRLCRI